MTETFGFNAQTQFKVPLSYINYVRMRDRAIVGHLYQFTSINGTNDYFTDLDIDVPYAGVIWKSGSLRIEGMRRKVTVGLNVDEQTVKIWAGPDDTLYGAAFLKGSEEGLLDGTFVTRQRVVWPLTTGNAANDITNGVAPVAVWTMFSGYIGEIEKGGPSHIEVKVRSPLVRLEVNMPRNYYQPGCLWTLFDTGCTLDKTIFAVNVTVDVGATVRRIPIVGGLTLYGADGIPYYASGRALFTSGINDNFLTLIDTNNAVALFMAYPLSTAPSAGDTMTIYPGCSKLFATCSAKFSNTANFRGFDKVPPVMMSM
jgi:hypothetical protein